MTTEFLVNIDEEVILVIGGAQIKVCHVPSIISGIFEAFQVKTPIAISGRLVSGDKTFHRIVEVMDATDIPPVDREQDQVSGLIHKPSGKTVILAHNPVKSVDADGNISE